MVSVNQKRLISPQTVDALKAQGYNCGMPGLPTWYDNGKWVGWNFPNPNIDGTYKIVRVQGSNPSGYTPMAAFLSGTNNAQKVITFVQKAGEGFSPLDLYVCNYPPYSGGGTGGGGGYRARRADARRAWRG
jgi:hypothetical protein